MKIDNDLLTKLEKLSSLKISDSKRDETIGQLSEIVNFVENLNELDLDNQLATFTTLEGGTPMRKDVSSSSKETIKVILENSPKHEGRFFSVPAIIE
ncbi:MAG: Asp-tRNA(Asn)/Glu-tRNA(Gln) amidotransferase GatCAB subunit C [Proteobacteria bacterium]|nr:MAG: Asp-tRNA(Asn)/Glu-tRNA(Gln) amidotransferase GatCAB subunit C [Pseudomonadota bacterium]